MKAETKLDVAYEYCVENDKSTEFMLQYLQDVAGVSLDAVLKYIRHKDESTHIQP